ncbi:hypothetical protein BGX28_010523 [Mortierella sp. GBA30]|nr:hypothetical protein BGX28_010523 [Mortierella sp. GBA30]
MLPSRISRFSASSSVAAGRHVLKSIYAAERPEGMGAIVRRSLGTIQMHHHDPFLLLDEFWVGSKDGFPDHPHRGFETVTYLFNGHLQHEDFAGHKGTIGPGDLQWMTAGRGIVHAEMPVKESKEHRSDGTSAIDSKDSLTAHGLQLWVNLSHKDKSCDPQYQDLRDHQIPRAKPKEGVEVKVIAGEAHGVKSKVYTRTPTMYLDYTMKKHQSIEQAIPKGYAGFVYMLSGAAFFGDGAASTKRSTGQKDVVDENKNKVKVNDDPATPFEGHAHEALILSQGDDTDEDTLRIQTTDQEAHFVVLAGQLIQEPIVQDRLFVMNSKDEVKQTLEDFRQFKNGFEKAKDWRSNIAPKGYRLKF